MFIVFLCNINHCNDSAPCWDLDWTIKSYLILSYKNTRGFPVKSAPIKSTLVKSAPIKSTLVKSAPSQIGLKMKVKSAPKK